MLHQRPRTGVQQHTSTAAKAHWHSIVSYRARSHAAAKASAQSSNDGPCDVSDPSCELTDPEAKFRRYGKHFGGGYKLTADWLKDVPRVRVRTSTARQQDELLELAVLNERLAGKIEPWQARQRLEYLKMRRKNWEQVYNYVTRTDAAATLSMIEEASQKVSSYAAIECGLPHAIVAATLPVRCRSDGLPPFAHRTRTPGWYLLLYVVPASVMTLGQSLLFQECHTCCLSKCVSETSGTLRALMCIAG